MEMRAVYSEQALSLLSVSECAVLDVSNASTSALQPASAAPLTTLNPAFRELARPVLTPCIRFLMDRRIHLAKKSENKI